MGIGPELLGGLAGSALAGAISPKQAKPGDPMVDYNKILNTALQQAIGTSTQYTGQAIDQQNKSLGQSTAITNAANAAANKQVMQTTNQGFNLGQGLLSPQRNAGYNALDAYMQSMGLATPQGGSLAQANQNAYTQSKGLLEQQYDKSRFNSVNPTAPTMGDKGTADQYISNTTDAQIHDWLNKQYATASSTGRGGVNFGGTGGTIKVGNKTVSLRGPDVQSLKDSGAYDQVKQLLGNQAYSANASALEGQYNQAQQTYNTQLDNYKYYQDYQDQLKQIQQQYQIGADGNPISAGTASTGGAPQAPAGSNAGLNNFLNSSQYQALFGSNPANTYAQTGQYDPAAAFRNDPGTQFAIQQGSKALQQQGAAKGILESGNMQTALQANAQGIANQNYQTYQGQIGQAFNQYQQQLASMTALGSQLTGANTAASMYGQAGQLQNQNIYGTGQQQSNATLSTGNNVSTLLGNQGVLNANAYLNTGAAQAAGMMQMLGMNAQANAAGAASNAQTQTAQGNSNAAQGATGMFNANAGNPTSVFSGGKY